MAELSKTFKVSASPHTIGKTTSRRIMLDVLIALVPSFIAGILFFGLNAVYTVVMCMVLCYASEQIYNLCLKKPFTTDLSCLVTGMILGLILPPKTPWYIPVVGSIFAIIFIKMLFGGVGKNIANPAATARVFLLLAFSSAMTSYLIPKFGDFVHMDGATGPTYLGGGFAYLDRTYMGVSGYWGYILQLFFGHMGGSIGETSAFAILIGCAYLMIRKVIDWRIPLSFITSSALMTLICYQKPADILPQLLSGGLMFGAVFMATDYATCPKYKHNKVLFGIFIGAITILLRKYSTYPESVSFAIILANLFVPVLDRFILPLRFGQTTKKGRVRPNIYGMTMQWIIPVFLVIIITLVSVISVVDPYVEKFYGKYVGDYTVAGQSDIVDSSDSKDVLAQKGDCLIPVSGVVFYKNASNKEQSEVVNYTLVLSKDSTARTATVKVKNIVQVKNDWDYSANSDSKPVKGLSYISIKNLKDTASVIEVNGEKILNTFQNKTLQEIESLTDTQLTVAAKNDDANEKTRALKSTQVNHFMQQAAIEAFTYYNFIEKKGVEQFTYQTNATTSFNGIDGVARSTQQSYFSITLQKRQDGQWIVANVIDHVVGDAGYCVNPNAFIGKTLSQVQKLSFQGGVTVMNKANNAMNRVLKEKVILAFQQAEKAQTTMTDLQQQRIIQNNKVEQKTGGVLCKKII